MSDTPLCDLFAALNPRAVRGGIGSSLPHRVRPAEYVAPTDDDSMPEAPITPERTCPPTGRPPPKVRATSLSTPKVAEVAPPAGLTPAAYLTQQECILLVASEMTPKFNIEDLIVRCFERYPARFSLRGYAHPNSNAVVARLSGSVGMVAVGWLSRPEVRIYALTPEGKAHARALKGA